mgnify:CR=1 FL=1
MPIAYIYNLYDVSSHNGLMGLLGRGFCRGFKFHFMPCHAISFHFIPFMGILAYKKEREEEGGGSVCVCVSNIYI